MTEEATARRHEVGLYVRHADEMLRVAEQNLAHGFYSTAVNRAYYAVFYAVNALLSTKQLSRGKHGGVIAAFRQHFISNSRFDFRLDTCASLAFGKHLVYTWD